MSDIHSYVDELVTAHGEDAVRAALEATPLFVNLRGGAQRSLKIAASTIENSIEGDDGYLIFRVPGIPGEPPVIGWASGELRMLDPNGTYEVTLPLPD